MGTNALHIIQKQSIDITLPDIGTALEWESKERDGFTKMVQQQLERCFDEYTRSGDHFIIGKLDVDLGMFSMNNLHEEMPARLYAEMRRILDEHRKRMVKDEPLFKDSADEGNHEPAKNNTADKFYTDQQARLKVFFFFLSNGYLPWWGSGIANWNEHWLQKLTPGDITSIREFLSGADDTVTLRLATQFSEIFIRQFIMMMGITENLVEPWNWLQQVFQAIKNEYAGKISEPALQGSSSSQQVFSIPFLHRQYWYGCIEYALGKQDKPTFLQLIGNNEAAIIFMRQFTQNEGFYPELRKTIPALWKHEFETFTEELRKDDNHIKNATDLLTNRNKEAVDEPTKARHSRKDNLNKKIKEAIEEREKLFVNEAGVVLLHPFLPQLFRNCGWLAKSNVPDRYARTMGVYAIYYLATGKTIVPEYELLLPKLLMGIPWEHPLEPVEELSEDNKAACNELLVEVVKHWTALRNTSPDGLKEAYLQRTGKLEYHNGNWRLGIEQKTQDILLSRLPWGISVIRYPWMENMLTVTWQ